ncbi:MAG: nicotinamide mononucleotide deamidase-related protein [Ignisphaera sp.]
MDIELDSWIFTLGNEIVQGRVINTNASFIGRRLTLLGFRVVGVLSLIDDVDVISRYISLVLKEKPRVIVSTGGLGPTHDDRTLEAISKAVNKRLVINQEALEMIKARYSLHGIELTIERIKMAYLPEGAIPIPNPIGTAPGSWLEVGETIIVSLPGVPKEMEIMWSSWVEPRLRAIGPPIHIVERLFVIEDVPEATFAPIVKDVLKVFSNLYIKTHPKGDEVGKQVLEVYVMYSHRDRNEAEVAIDNAIQLLHKKFRERYGTELKSMLVKVK